jgi:hypothetical protein
VRAEAVRKASEDATRNGFAQISNAVAQGQPLQAYALAYALEKSAARTTVGSNEVRLAAQALCQKKRQDAENSLAQIPCAKRVALYQQFLSSRSDLDAEVRATLESDLEKCLNREKQAKDIQKKVESAYPASAQWYEALKNLFDNYGDTEAAEALSSRKAAVEAYYKKR